MYFISTNTVHQSFHLWYWLSLENYAKVNDALKNALIISNDDHSQIIKDYSYEQGCGSWCFDGFGSGFHNKMQSGSDFQNIVGSGIGLQNMFGSGIGLQNMVGSGSRF